MVDLLFYFLRERLEANFTVGGDFNTSRLPDDLWAEAGTREFFDGSAKRGFVPLHRLSHDRDLQTPFQEGRHPHQLDNLYVDRSTAPLVRSSDVVTHDEGRRLQRPRSTGRRAGGLAADRWLTLFIPHLKRQEALGVSRVFLVHPDRDVKGVGGATSFGHLSRTNPARHPQAAKHFGVSYQTAGAGTRKECRRRRIFSEPPFVPPEAMTDQTLREATEALDIEVPNLMQGRELSLRILDEAQEQLTSVVPPEEIEADVIALGSLARLEASRESDFDYLVVMHSLPSDVRTGRRLIDAAEDVRSGLGLGEPGPGLFARVISAPDLTENIGLEDDTNVTHSLRILTLEESSSVYRPELHERLLRAILDRYLADAERARVPRFLLNDVVRYWRTLAVDYQAKRWKSVERGGWGLRYLKLIISRKLTFAGTLTSIFLVEPPTTEGLISQFRLPALSRLAQLHEHIEDDYKEDLAAVLLIADEFIESLAHEDFREEAKGVQMRSEIEPGSGFASMRDRARTLQGHLERLFFDTQVLGEKSRRYLSF